jgi:glucose dehydrogenase
MRSPWMALWVACALAPTALAQQTNTPSETGADWSMYAGNLAGTKYSALKQIDTRNVSQLAQAWSYRLAERGAFETTP